MARTAKQVTETLTKAAGFPAQRMEGYFAAWHLSFDLLEAAAAKLGDVEVRTLLRSVPNGDETDKGVVLIDA